MNIIRICVAIISDGLGGAEVIVQELVRNLRSRGEEVSLVANDEVLRHCRGLEGVTLLNVGKYYSRPIRISWMSGTAHRNGTLVSIVNYAGDLLRDICIALRRHKIRKMIGDFLRENKIEILHSHRAEADVLMSRLPDSQIPMVTTIHGEHALTGRGPQHWLLKPLIVRKSNVYRRALLDFDLVCAVCKYELEALKTWGLPSSVRSQVVYNGVNIDRIREIPSSSSAKPSGYSILFPGGGKWYKGGDIAVNTLTNIRGDIPSVHLYLALEVSEHHSLRDLVSDLGVDSNITFCGFLDWEKYISLLKSMDLLLMPSRREAFPLAIIEAMACGIPVIATDVGGIPEIVRNGVNGLLVDVNPTSVSEGVRALATHPEVAKQIAERASADVEMYGLSRMVDKYVSLYRQLIDSDHRST